VKRFTPIVVALAVVASLMSANVSIGEAAAIQDIKVHAPAHGHATATRIERGLSADSASSTVSCDWWGGYLHQYQYGTRLVVEDAYGDCEGTSSTWSSTLMANSASIGQKSTAVTNTVPADWRAISKEWGPVAVGESMNWAWQVYITLPSGTTWTSVDDPTHCHIDTNQQVVICLYNGGGVIPWFTSATNTPTATPFPTLTGMSTCADAYAYVAPIPKSPHTQTVNMSETYVVGDTWTNQGKGFNKIVRLLRWNNLTTNGSGQYTRNIAIKPDIYLVFYDEQAFVGNGFITVTIDVQAQMLDGTRCNMIASNNVTN
jgi:hypothetical protein